MQQAWFCLDLPPPQAPWSAHPAPAALSSGLKAVARDKSDVATTAVITGIII